MNIAGMHLTDFHKKKLIKDAKYEKKVRTRRIESLTIEEHVKLKSIMSQFYCTVALQIELVDALEEMKMLNGYPFVEDLRKAVIFMNNSMYESAVKNEEDDLVRQVWEKKMENIVKIMPQLNAKQFDLLEEFIKNLKYKK